MFQDYHCAFAIALSRLPRLNDKPKPTILGDYLKSGKAITEMTRELTPAILKHFALKAVHPAADILPLMTDEEFEELCGAVKERGFHNPIRVTPHSILLDGRNRLLAAYRLKLKPPVETVDPKNPLLWVLDQNVHRRHLSVGQRAMIAERLANMPHGRSEGRKERKPVLTLVSLKEAAAGLKTNQQSVSQARVIRQHAPEEAVKVEAGTMSLGAAYDIAKDKKLRTQAGVEEVPEAEKPDVRRFMDRLSNSFLKILDSQSLASRKVEEVIAVRDSIEDDNLSLKALIGSLRSLAESAERLAGLLESPPPLLRRQNSHS